MTDNHLSLEPTATSKKSNNISICEALGCQENATEIIEVNAGEFGKITLNLCKYCIPKFTTQG